MVKLLNPNNNYWLITVLLLVMPFLTISQITINSESFDSGFGVWEDLNTSNGDADWNIGYDKPFNNDASIRLRDNSNSNSATQLLNDLDLTSYSSVEISFDYESEAFDISDDYFFIEFYNGSSWVEIQRFNFGSNGFNNNGTNYVASVTIDNSSNNFASDSNFRIECRADGNGERVYIDNIIITGYSAATNSAINVQGNNVDITDGDTTPSILDFSNFGTTNLSDSRTRTFTIQNLGIGILSLNGSPIVQSSNTAFNVSTQPSASSISSGGADLSFEVTFNPSSTGIFQSIISIPNDGSTFTFTIRADVSQTFFDSDGDGVFDDIDIDDDNDGIRDSEEESSCKLSSISSTTNYKFLNETFGTGARTTINTTYNAETTYCYEVGIVGSNTVGCPDLDDVSMNDGEYTVGSSAQIASWASDYWYTGTDHTGDTNGRMALFNASYEPGLFYSASIVGSLPNVPITYSFWVLNIDRTDNPMANAGTSRLKPNILVEFRDVNNNLLASISTGAIPYSSAGSNQTSDWHQFTADLTFNVDEFYVYFYNNETGGLGNDLAIDDIVISQTLCDTDSDTVADLFDLDSDNDGIPDVVEAGVGDLSAGTAKIPYSSGWIDSNLNGMHDNAEANVTLNSDSDATPNFLDLDSDNDGIFDVDESGAGNSADVYFQNGDGDISGNGVGQGSDSDFVRETDVNADDVLEYFTDGILDIYDYYNGDSFITAYGNENQGLGNTFFVLDSDGDGLPDYMDTTSDGATYDISHTLYANLANALGVIDDANDIEGDGIVDLFDTDDTAFGSPRDLDRKLHLYFDGRNDYAEDVSVIDNWSEATIMTWIKMDPSSMGVQRILGQNEFYLQLNGNKTVTAFADGNTLTTTVLNTNQWIHLAATYSSSDGFKLFLNGDQVDNDSGVSGTLPADTSFFTIGKNSNSNSDFYHGYLDEVRVFNKALTNNELQKIVYQEIQNNGGVVLGSIIPLNITDYSGEVSTELDWSYLLRYFKMDVYKDDIIDDLSTALIDIGTGATIYNTKIIDVQTAPLPFKTQIGDTDLATALSTSEGIVGSDAITHDASIVKIEHKNITSNSHQQHVGLFVNEKDAISNDIEYSIQNSSELNVSFYFKLDGFVDLEDESQLVQGGESIIDANSTGYIERDQQGTANSFNYNYWSSSVAPVDSNWNDNFNIKNVIKDGTDDTTPIAINFGTGTYWADGTYSGSKRISTRWLYTFYGKNDHYESWKSINHNTFLNPGEGYTMKGTSGAVPLSSEQNYVFIGKPYNGSFNLTIDENSITPAGDVERLIGNPYPSAIDANEFILDNISESGGRNSENVFNGALYFWHHFGQENSHILREYVGGYATYTLMGGTEAYSTSDRINNSDPLTGGGKTPTGYIPVNQGFFVRTALEGISGEVAIVDGGDIVFKNSQRTFRTEDSGESVFMKTEKSKKKKKKNPNDEGDIEKEDKRPKIRLKFESPLGYHRELLIGADENTSNEFDLGYEGFLIDQGVEDMFWIIEEGKFVIQGVPNFKKNQRFNLGLTVNKSGIVKIYTSELENLEPDFDLYIFDKLLNSTHSLVNSTFEIELEPGEYLDRFALVFKHEKDNDDNENDAQITFDDLFYVYMDNDNSELQISLLKDIELKKIAIFDSFGRKVASKKIKHQSQHHYLKLNNVITGVYLVEIQTKRDKFYKRFLVK